MGLENMQARRILLVQMRTATWTPTSLLAPGPCPVAVANRRTDTPLRNRHSSAPSPNEPHPSQSFNTIHVESNKKKNNLQKRKKHEKNAELLGDDDDNCSTLGTSCTVRRLVARVTLVDTDDHGVISLVRLQCQLFCDCQLLRVLYMGSRRLCRGGDAVRSISDHSGVQQMPR